MRDDFGVGLRREHVALGAESIAQLAEILDDAVVDDRDLVCGVRVRVVFRRAPVRRPARMADPLVPSNGC